MRKHEKKTENKSWLEHVKLKKKLVLDEPHTILYCTVLCCDVRSLQLYSGAVLLYRDS